MHKSRWRWLWCALPGAVGVGLYLLLPLFPSFTETVMMRGVFRVIAVPLEWLVAWLPFSLAEIAVLTIIPLALALLTIWVIRLVRLPNKKERAKRGAQRIVLWASAALLLYMITHGAGYSRQPLAQLMNLPQRPYTSSDLLAVTADLAQKASAARERLPEDASGCAALTVSTHDLLGMAQEMYAPLRKQYPFLITGTHRVKGVMLSHPWSYTGYTGMYCPWLGEANLNVDVPAFDLAHTMAHELGHTMGIAREKDCNFLGYLACVTSGQPDMVYSGYLSAYVYCSNELYRHNPELWAQASTHCSPGMRRDLAARNAYWQQFEGEVRQTAQKVNDTFIKANGVQSGVGSYNEMVELMLRYYHDQGWI